MMKYYFENSEAEICYNEDYFIGLMLYRNIESIEVFTAIPEKMEGVFWCSAMDLLGEIGACETTCDSFDLGNDGNCKYFTNDLFIHGELTTLKL